MNTLAEPATVAVESDIDLADLRALQRGEDSALNRVIERWERRLFGFAWRYLQNSTDAQDLVADVFVRFYQQRHRFADDMNVAAWLFTALANLCRNHHRWRRRHPAFAATPRPDDAPDVPQEIVADSLLPSETLEQQERIAALGQAIDRLPPDLKLTLLLHHYERLSYREIAAITGCTEAGVDTRLYRARAKLRAALSSKFARE